MARSDNRKTVSGVSTTAAIIITRIMACRAWLPYFVHIAGPRVGEFGTGWFRRRVVAAVILLESPI
jgi:hypothetical protein